MTSDTLISQLHSYPDDGVLRHAIADMLEESDQNARAELLRLQMASLELCPYCEEREAIDKRIIELIDAGVQPVVPEFTNSIGMRFALIPAGTFLMGSPDGEEKRASDEGPQHLVLLTKPYYLSIYPVTQSQWRAVMGSNPSYFSAAGGGSSRVAGLDTSDFPVENVSWNDTQEFLKKLSELPAEQGRSYRLPTEAEWERACRGGLANMPFHYGNSLSSYQANFSGDFPYGDAPKGPHLERPCKVGSYKPNAFGLYDMHGNVWEWCQDWYNQNYYQQCVDQAKQDLPDGVMPSDASEESGCPHLRSGWWGMPDCEEMPQNNVDGSRRVYRGGSWYNLGHRCRSAFRRFTVPTHRVSGVGCRVALSVDPQNNTDGPCRAVLGGSWRSFGQFCRSAYRDDAVPSLRGRHLGCRPVIDLESQWCR